jgi:glycosidase
VFALSWSMRPVRRRLLAVATLLLFLASMLPLAAATPLASPMALASHTPAPTSVTLVGSLQNEAGCAGDWDPACAATHLTYDAADDVWQGTFTLPAGSYEYKVALNGSWDENYGLDAAPGGAKIPLALGAGKTVKFYYSHGTHWVADNVGKVIATVAGSFQSELGCPGDWDPSCLRSWLQDPDGDGTYSFATTSIPAGSYEAKVALDEAWDVNYGDGGVQNGANIAFTVPAHGKVTFGYDAATHVLTVTAASLDPQPDNNVEWDGLRHDSRDTLYRTPQGAVPAGTPVTLRLRTFHNDVTGVEIRFYSVDRGGAELVSMKIAASGVDCYQADLAGKSCDYWQVTLPVSLGSDNLWYRFIVTDGTDTDYYADDTAALDGGLGAATDDQVDRSWALMLYEPGFAAPSWAKDAVVYQIFPDRFRNGRKDNDPKTGDVRYDAPVTKLAWGLNPEGYCRNYADASATTCPVRFAGGVPSSTGTETPLGRDYFGGDLKGVDQQLDYLRALGVNTVYFNPIFDSGSNHGYDTQDYRNVDPYFGTQKDFDNLVKHADKRGIRIVLDGVFNHLSSDSPIFDRYGHYSTVGACESTSSPFRSWFIFHDVAAGTGTCAGAGGAKSATYDGWFGFDSIPVIDKSQANTSVWSYFLTGSDAIATRWLKLGASGWRLDVAGDASFPAGYWETFRDVVKTTSPQALTISETWQKDSTLLRMIRGDRLDTTMNYRLRDAVLGFLAPGAFDSKGFPDSGNVIAPSDFLDRLSSIREDYPDAAYYSLMNLLDSHDTERLLWTLTPGQETTADKETSASNVAAGKQRVRIASLIQFTLPGAPTVYYGDEVGVTGDDDPGDRRTYPWADLGGKPDTGLLAHYTALANARRDYAVLRTGDFEALLADDTAGIAAYGRRTSSQAALVVLNRGTAAATMDVPVAGYLRDGVTFARAYAVGSGASASATSAAGSVRVTVPANGGVLLVSGNVDLAGPPAPTLTLAGEGNGSLDVSWTTVSGAVSYDVWTSPVSGGGWVKASASPVTGTTYTVTGLDNGIATHVVVTATDAAGNGGVYSNEVTGLPHYAIGWANLQWPPSMSHTISTVNRTDTAYGQVWIDGVTNQPGATPGLRAQLGFGPDGSNPDGNAAWTWVDGGFNIDAGNNDEYRASMQPEVVGQFDYAWRYSTTGGRDWVYADLDGIGNGYSAAQAGALSVSSSGDTTAPATPANLRVVSASPAGIELAWDAVAGDPTLWGYEVQRSAAAGGPWDVLVRVSGATSYLDTAVAEGETWHYRVVAIDMSFNRSDPSASVAGTAQLRTVTLVFNLTVPATTDATGRAVNIAGFLDRLDGGYPQWTPGGAPMTRTDATHWTITFTGKEGTQLEYKYALGSWDYVEKDNACGEIANRQLTLAYGATGTQTVNDDVLNWRNVAPCGN